MHSRIERAPIPRRPAVPRRCHRYGCRSGYKVTLRLLLTAVCLFSAVAQFSSPTVALAVGATGRSGDSLPKLAGLAEPLLHAYAALAETEEPPQGTPPVEPQPTIEQTPEAPDDTAEPPIEETPEVPPETVEPTAETVGPTPDETSAPPNETGEPPAELSPEPEETLEPQPTEPAAAEETATALASPTPTVSVWSESWLAGDIYFGAEEASLPDAPVQIAVVEWLRLGLTLVVVSLVAIFGGRLLYWLLSWAIKRRNLNVDKTLLVHLRPLLSWWLAAIAFQIAVLWVNFENEPAQELFANLTFLAYLGVATLTVWRLVDHAIDLYANRIVSEGQADYIEKLRPLMRRWARILIVLVSGLIGLGRLDIGFSVSTVLVMAIGLTIVLAARDTIQDVVVGFSILIDQPFRIGDRIEVQGIDTWAEVVDIGLRSSVLRTRHNVEVIVPNSTIGKGQVINYSYPDSRYRMQTHVGIAFGTDVEYARQVMIDAVRLTEYVLPDEPVQALYVEIGDSDMVFRVRWWIDFDRDWERAFDSVHTALHIALADAGIDSPYPSQSLNVQVDDQTLAEVWQAWREESQAGTTG